MSNRETTMKTKWYSLIVLSLSAVIVAEEPTPNTADKFGPEARSAYLRWKKATFEANGIYVSELKTALEKATRQGSLDEAVAIKGEIERVSSASSAIKPIPLSDFLTGTSWTSGLNDATVILKEGGKGVRKQNGQEAAISWRVNTEKEFTIRWPVGTSSTFLVADDRKSSRSGDATWTLK